MGLTLAAQTNAIQLGSITHAELDQWMRLRNQVVLYELEIERAAELCDESRWLQSMRLYREAVDALTSYVNTLAEMDAQYAAAEVVQWCEGRR